MKYRNLLGLSLFVIVISFAPSRAVAQAPDATWTFDANFSSDYRLTTVSSPLVYNGPIPADDPTLNLVIGRRYSVVNVNPLTHPLQIIGKASVFTNDAILLSQGATAGSMEGDAGVAWQDSGGAVTFTVTAALVSAMQAGGNAPGYRCEVHVDTMRGDFNIAAAPTTPTLVSNQSSFVALLNGQQAGTTSTAVGIGRFFVNTTANTLTYDIRYGGLTTTETVSHIHGAADVGVSTGVKHPLPLGRVKNGQWHYNEADEPDILAGRMYVNIHSTRYPAGEIRGQIVNLVAQIDGTQDGTPSSATGTGLFIINTATNQLRFDVRYTTLTVPETASHIHGVAPISVNAPVIHPLPLGTVKTGTWTYPENFEQPLLSGRTYANIHSVTFPGGEIRGQITPYVTFLDDEQARTTSTAHGTGVFSFETSPSQQLGYYFRYSDLSASETASHFHGPAFPGHNAPVLFPTSPTLGVKIGLWNYPANVQAFIAKNRTYMNIHSTMYPAGEIRGQVWIINGPIPSAIDEKIPPGDIRVELRLLREGLTAPLGVIDPDDGTRRLFIYDQAGTVTVMQGPASEPIPLLDVTNRLVPLGLFGPGSFDERGLIGFALHPNFRQNGKLYTFTSEPTSGTADFTTDPPTTGTFNCQSVIAEWTVTPPTGKRVDPASRRELLRVDKPQFNHNGGTMRFGPDGFLYAVLGDGGGADDQDGQPFIGGVPVFGHGSTGNGQNLDRLLGKMIRIDVDGSNSANGNYGIPADNPFVGRAGLDEIYAYGFRNPFMFSFDRATSDIWVGDVGQNDIEEIDNVVKGANYGWRLKEGPLAFDASSTGPGFVTSIPPQPIPHDLIEPLAQYDHDEGLAILGGFVYRGHAIPELRGHYVFGDFGFFSALPSGRLFYLNGGQIKELLIGIEGRRPDIWIKGFGEDAQGELYVCGSTSLGVSLNSGKVYRIARFRKDILGADRRWILFR